MKKIFLTGSGGFIGKNVIEILGAKHDFLKPRSSELDLLDEIQVYNFLKENRPEIVIHAANVGVFRKDLGINDLAYKNIRMFLNIIRGKEYFDRMIVFGSGAEYAKTREIVDIREENFDEFVPQDEYGYAKYAMAKYAENVGFITHLRPFGVYGKYADYTVRFISNMICRALYDLPLVVNQDTAFDYLFVDDLVRILDLMIESKPRHVFYNLGGQRQTLLGITQLINYLVGKKLPVSVRREGFNREYTCNIKRFKNEYKDFIFTDFEKSLISLIDYHRKNFDSIDKLELLKT